MITSKEELSPKRLGKRKAIVDAAIEVFAQKGFNGAKIADVARLAGVADGTVYIYFENKDDLLMQAMQELITEKLIKIKKRVAKETCARERLYKFFELHIDMFTKNPSVARFMVVELRQSKDFYTRYPSFTPLTEYFSYVQNLVMDAIEEGQVIKVNPHTLTCMIMGTMDFVLMQWSLSQEKISLRQIVPEIREIFHNGLAVQ